ncbi:MAG: lipopolysaccharide biosynthesis protein [Candidatus Melainabacteria bacterium]
MNLWNRFMMGSVTSVAGTVMRTAVNVLAIPLLMAVLGSDQYGLFVLLIGVVELSLLADLGFSTALTQILGKTLYSGDPVQDEQARQDALTHETAHVLGIGQWVYGALTLLMLAAAILLPGLVVGWFHLPLPDIAEGRFLFALAFVVGAVYIYSCYFRSVLLTHCLHQWNNLGDVINYVGGTALGLLFVWLGWGLAGFMLARLLAAVGMLLLLRRQAAVAQRETLLLPARIPLTTLRHVLGLTGHAAMNQISVIISHKIDTFVIAANLTLRSVGLFEIVVRITAVIAHLITRVSQGVFPIFTYYAARQDREGARRFYLQYSSLINWVGMLVLMCLAVYFGPVLALFSAGKFGVEETWPLFAVMLLIVWSAILQGPAGFYLFASGEHRFLSVSGLVTAGCNLGLSLLLVKPYGALGVALGTLIPQGIQHQFFLIGRSNAGLGIRPWEYISRVHLRFWPVLGAAWAAMMRIGELPGMRHPVAIVLVSLGVAAAATVVAYRLVLQDGERQIIRDRVLTPLFSARHNARSVSHV